MHIFYFYSIPRENILIMLAPGIGEFTKYCVFKYKIKFRLKRQGTGIKLRILPARATWTTLVFWKTDSKFISVIFAVFKCITIWEIQEAQELESKWHFTYFLCRPDRHRWTNEPTTQHQIFGETEKAFSGNSRNVEGCLCR